MLAVLTVDRQPAPREEREFDEPPESGSAAERTRADERQNEVVSVV